MTDQAFSVAKLAARWGRSQDTIYSLIHSGELPAFRVGSRLIRIRAEEVTKYEQKIGIHEPVGPGPIVEGLNPARPHQSSQRLIDLANRLSHKMEKGRTIQLSSEDLDWLVVSGAYEALTQAVVQQAVAQSRARLEAKGMDLSFLDLSQTQSAGEMGPEAEAEQILPERPRRR